jgi:STE24 endopeptidase
MLIQLLKVPAMLWVGCAKVLEALGDQGYIGKGGARYHNDILQGAVFIAIVTIYSEVTNVSWSLFSTFNIKERHGFNKSTLGIFFGDKIKTLLLVILIGGPVYWGFMELIIWGGDKFYIYLSIFSMVVIVLLVNLGPNLIMPLFNKYDDLE